MLKLFEEGNQTENEVRKGRSTKLTKCDKRFITIKFLKYLRLSAGIVTAKFNEKFSTSVSPRTV